MSAELLAIAVSGVDAYRRHFGPLFKESEFLIWSDCLTGELIVVGRQGAFPFSWPKPLPRKAMPMPEPLPRTASEDHPLPGKGDRLMNQETVVTSINIHLQDEHLNGFQVQRPAFLPGRAWIELGGGVSLWVSRLSAGALIEALQVAMESLEASELEVTS